MKLSISELKTICDQRNLKYDENATEESLTKLIEESTPKAELASEKEEFSGEY